MVAIHSWAERARRRAAGFCLETVLAEQAISLLREVAAGIGFPSTRCSNPSDAGRAVSR